MSKDIRVRFAPSPTGPLHMGGVRTALYNYLFAKKKGGKFILRLEDTDQTRFVGGAEKYILESLAWCGISPNEGLGSEEQPYGPYRQSERKEIYRQYADQLLESGHAYYAFDTSEELENMRERLKAAGNPSPQYNAITRTSMKNSLSLSAEEVEKRLAAGDPYVIRVKMPRNEEVKFEDIIRGVVVVNTQNLDDKVLFKSDGMPTYHLANIVDDHLMKISHVIRGEEWLPSAPLHVLLYQFLGWDRPEFAHLPLILKPDGNGKLSKRDGDRLGFPVFPLVWENPETGEEASGYRESGYYPEAFVNMMAFLGWNPGTEQEIFDLEGLVEAFDLDRVGKAGARFDPDKTRWFNQQHLRQRTDAELAEELKPMILEAGLNVPERELEEMVGLLKERATFLKEMIQEGAYFFQSPKEYDAKTVSKKWKEDSPALLADLRDELQEIEDWSSENIEARFKAFMEAKEIGFGKIGPVFRLALTGKGMGPSLFDISALLGKEEVMNRLNAGIENIEK